MDVAFWGITMRALCIFVALAVGGCASTQLNYNTLDLAGTVDQLVAQQVIYNVIKFVENPEAIPSLVSLPAGSATTINNIGASWSDPISKAKAVTDNLAAVSTGASTRTISHAITTNSMTVTPSVSDQWSQNWTLAPITDPDQMRRVRAIYRYALGYSYDKKDLPQECAKRPTNDPCPTIQDEYASIYKSVSSGADTGMLILDNVYLRKPGCVLCTDKKLSDGTDRLSVDDLNVNERLKWGFLRWHSGSYHSVQPPNPQTDVSLGTYGPYELFAGGQRSNSANRTAFAEFVLFVLEGTLSTTSGAGGGKGGGKGLFIIPGSGIVTQ